MTDDVIKFLQFLIILDMFLTSIAGVSVIVLQMAKARLSDQARTSIHDYAEDGGPGVV